VSNEFAQILRLGRSIAVHLALLALVALAAVLPPQTAVAQTIKGEISVTVENGFARFVLQFAEEIETKARVANNILTISFEKPVDIAVDRVSANSGGYVAAARRDPDRKAIRFALARKVTMNSIAAAERVFVDLLPEGWSGMTPGLPREVIEDLARRAREAERKTRQQRALARQAPSAPIRLRVAIQPTFTRYISRAGRRLRRQQQGQADADLRRGVQVRSCRRGRGAAADGQLDHQRGCTGNRDRTFQLFHHGRCAYLS
jgi:hypothetical protein